MYLSSVVVFSNEVFLMIGYDNIIPYVGTENIKLYQTVDEIKSVLKENDVIYREEVWNSEYETVPNPWTVLVIDGILSIFFAKNNKLFKLVFWEGYQGTLPNGIKTGMAIETAKTLDPSLAYDDWNEDYQSQNGYWLEDDPESGTVMSISIFIREILDEETFDQCKW